VCSVLLLHRVLADAALAVLFVRDEDPARRGLAPGILAGAPPVLAPRDPRAGGTWFGLAAAAFLAGLVNRPEDPLPEGARSRGLLLLDALRAATPRQALEHAAGAAAARPHGGCRVFAGDGRVLLWRELPAAGPPGPVRTLEPGTWLLRHRQPPRPAPGSLLPAAPGVHFLEWWGGIRPLLRAHGPASDPLCLHGDRRASVDTTLAVLDPAGRPVRLAHRPGPPCAGPLRDASALLRFLAGSGT